MRRRERRRSGGDPEGEAVLAWWREENERVRAEATGDPEREADVARQLPHDAAGGSAARAAHVRATRGDHEADAGHPAEHGMPYSRRIVDMLARCVAGSRLVVVPAVTHFMSYQAPDAFNEVVLGFLAEH